MPETSYGNDQETKYQILISEEGFKRLDQYKKNLSTGNVSAGSNLTKAIISKVAVIANNDSYYTVSSGASEKYLTLPSPIADFSELMNEEEFKNLLKENQEQIEEDQSKDLAHNLIDLIIKKISPKTELSESGLKELVTNSIVKAGANTLDQYEFIECFLQSREEYIMAEQNTGGEKAVKENRWSKEEVQLSALMSLAIEVEVYDNGERRNPTVHDVPFNALMAYVSGPLNRDYADQDEIADDQKFYQLIEERLLPVFGYFNQELQKQGKNGFVTLPLIGCGAFGTNAKKFYQTFEQFIKSNADKFRNIKGVYIDDFKGELISAEEKRNNIKNITLIKGGGSSSGERKAQLLNPKNGNYGEEFKDCMLCNLVAWDPLYREGNEGRTAYNNRISDDPAKLRATNTLAITNNEAGSYDQSLKSFKLAREVEGETIFSLQHKAGNKRILLRTTDKNILVFDQNAKLRETERFNILSPSKIKEAGESSKIYSKSQLRKPISYSLKDYGFLGVHNQSDLGVDESKPDSLNNFIVVDPAGSAFTGNLTNGSDDSLVGEGASGALYKTFNKRPSYNYFHNRNTKEYKEHKEGFDSLTEQTLNISKLEAGEAVWNNIYFKVEENDPWGIIHAVGPNARIPEQKEHFKELLTTTLKNVFLQHHHSTIQIEGVDQKPGLRIPLISGSIFLGDIREEEYYRFFTAAMNDGYNAALSELGIEEIDFGKKGIEVCCYGQKIKEAFEKAQLTKPASATTKATPSRERRFSRSEIESGQIVAIDNPSSPSTITIPIASVRSEFIKKDYYQDESGQYLAEESRTELSQKEIAEKASNMASLIINSSFNKISSDSKNNQSKEYWEGTFNYFETIMRSLIKDKIKSASDTGKEVGFQAWRNDIETDLRTNNPGADNEKIENWMQDLQLVSRTIQEEATKYFGSALGRKYNKTLEGQEIGARSYRIIQLLGDESGRPTRDITKLKFEPKLVRANGVSFSR